MPTPARTRSVHARPRRSVAHNTSKCNGNRQNLIFKRTVAVAEEVGVLGRVFREVVENIERAIEPGARVVDACAQSVPKRAEDRRHVEDRPALKALAGREESHARRHFVVNDGV